MTADARNSYPVKEKQMNTFLMRDKFPVRQVQICDVCRLKVACRARKIDWGPELTGSG